MSIYRTPPDCGLAILGNYLNTDAGVIPNIDKDIQMITNQNKEVYHTTNCIVSLLQISQQEAIKHFTEVHKFKQITDWTKSKTEIINPKTKLPERDLVAIFQKPMLKLTIK